MEVPFILGDRQGAHMAHMEVDPGQPGIRDTVKKAGDAAGRALASATGKQVVRSAKVSGGVSLVLISQLAKLIPGPFDLSSYPFTLGATLLAEETHLARKLIAKYRRDYPDMGKQLIEDCRKSIPSLGAKLDALTHPDQVLGPAPVVPAPAPTADEDDDAGPAQLIMDGLLLPPRPQKPQIQGALPGAAPKAAIGGLARLLKNIKISRIGKIITGIVLGVKLAAKATRIGIKLAGYAIKAIRWWNKIKKYLPKTPKAPKLPKAPKTGVADAAGKVVPPKAPLRRRRPGEGAPGRARLLAAEFEAARPVAAARPARRPAPAPVLKPRSPR